MWDLAAIVVAFLVVSAGVAALARSTTARWERERRAARRSRRPAAGPPPPRTVPGERLGRAVTAAAAIARPAAALVRGRLRGARRHLVAVRRHVAGGEHVARGEPAARVVVPQPRGDGDPPVDGSAVGGGVPPAPGTHRWLQLPRRRRTAGPRLTHRLTARVGHLPALRGSSRPPDDPGGPAA